MNAFRSALLAGVAVLATVPPASTADMGADEFAKAFMEILDAHGFPGATYESVTLDNGTLTLSGIATPAGEGARRFAARTLVIDQIKESDGKDSGWLGFRSFEAADAEIVSGGLSISIPYVRLEELFVQNTNDEEDAAANGYEYIDGPYSNFRFTSAEASGISMSFGGVEALFSAAANAGNWQEGARLPRSLDLSVAGNLSFGGASVEDMRLHAEIARHASFDIMVVSARGETAAGDAFSTRLGFGAMTPSRVNDLVLRLFGSESTEGQVRDATVTSFAAAVRGFSWLPLDAALSVIAGGSGDAFASSLRDGAQHLMGGGGEARVYEFSPKSAEPVGSILDGGVPSEAVVRR